ncbi:hypothetical protein SNEBB_007655 [Seison nebaliae]|nr:hypothetical protein SNEBB_007655 [Seison nebaliae]
MSDEKVEEIMQEYDSERLRIYRQMQDGIDSINRTIYEIDMHLPHFQDKSAIELSNSEIDNFNKDIRKIEEENIKEMENRKKEINELMENIHNDLLNTVRENIGVDPHLSTSQSIYNIVKDSEKSNNNEI